MATLTSIEWTDRTWNPVRGCSRVSEGCRHCYAEGIAARFGGAGQPYEGLGAFVDRPGGKREARWTGAVRLAESVLTEPLSWRKPAFVFVNSMSDLFHEALPDEAIDKVFAVMALAPHLTFQVLTKRPERMREYMRALTLKRLMDVVPSGTWPITRHHAMAVLDPCATSFHRQIYDAKCPGLPLPNVWVGTSVEDQATADARIPILLDTPAAVRFVSAEPLLGPVDLRQMHGFHNGCVPQTHDSLSGYSSDTPWAFVANKIPDPFGRGRLDWVICGGESGPGARPMQPDWARGLRDQCAAAHVSFFMKQMTKKAVIPADLMVREFPHAVR